MPLAAIPPRKVLRRLGYEKGKQFIDGVRKKTISDKELNDKVPIGLLSVMAGPTTDFMLGRIYEEATSDALDEIVKRHGTGALDLPPGQWLVDKDAQKTVAETRYAAENCSLLK